MTATKAPPKPLDPADQNTVKASTPKPKRTPPAAKPEAKPDDLSVAHAKVLKALAGATSPMTYQDIKAQTGYYKNLTKVLRASHEGSLTALGFAKEMELKPAAEGQKPKLAFIATAAGKKKAAKLSD